MLVAEQHWQAASPQQGIHDAISGEPGQSPASRHTQGDEVAVVFGGSGENGVCRASISRHEPGCGRTNAVVSLPQQRLGSVPILLYGENNQCDSPGTGPGGRELQGIQRFAAVVERYQDSLDFPHWVLDAQGRQVGAGNDELQGTAGEEGTRVIPRSFPSPHHKEIEFRAACNDLIHPNPLGGSEVNKKRAPARAPVS